MIGYAAIQLAVITNTAKWCSAHIHKATLNAVVDAV